MILRAAEAADEKTSYGASIAEPKILEGQTNTRSTVPEGYPGGSAVKHETPGSKSNNVLQLIQRRINSLNHEKRKTMNYGDQHEMENARKEQVKRPQL